MKKKTRQPERRRWMEEMIDSIDRFKSEDGKEKLATKKVLLTMLKQLEILADEAGLPDLRFELGPDLKTIFSNSSDKISEIPRIGLFTCDDEWAYSLVLAQAVSAVGFKMPEGDGINYMMHEDIITCTTFLRLKEDRTTEIFCNGDWYDVTEEWQLRA